MMSKASPVRRSEIFTGGEVLEDNSGIKASSFYNTIKDMPKLRVIYALAEKKIFDIYEDGNRVVSTLTNFLRWLHNGILPTYLVWCLIGMLYLFFTLMR
jgi:hypothetical protein